MFGSSNLEDQPQGYYLGQAITDMWVNGEQGLFPWDQQGQPNPDMGGFDGWGHFSQVVWVNSQTVGCATQLCKKGSPMSDSMDVYFTVCDYGPAGESFEFFNH
jgi:hypothetical protein